MVFYIRWELDGYLAKKTKAYYRNLITENGICYSYCLKSYSAKSNKGGTFKIDVFRDFDTQVLGNTNNFCVRSMPASDTCYPISPAKSLNVVCYIYNHAGTRITKSNRAVKSCHSYFIRLKNSL